MALALVLCAASSLAGAVGTGKAIAWKDVAGRAYSQADLSKNKATVFLFVSTQCPIANIYTPRFLELARDFQPRGVGFFLVDSNIEDTPAVVKRYARERKFPFPVVKDNGTALADWLLADTTPQAIVLDAGGQTRYMGRIDDNKDRAKVSRHDLREALDAVLAGKPVKQARTLAVGCAIFRDKPRTPVTKTKVTYARDVASILNANCVICHRSGEVAPFALETYKQARTWATAIKDYTARRLMPPWKPAGGFGDFHDARSLTDSQIAMLTAWADAGAPEGNPKETPPAPKFPDPEGWQLGKPDVVLQADRPYHLDAEGDDVYRNYVLPIDFTEDRYVSSIEFKPGNRAIVHHIVTYIDPRAESVKFDGKEKEPGYSVPGNTGGIGILDAIWGEVWVPGNSPRALPTGMALKIPKGAKLVMQVHYHKTGKPEVDHSRMAMTFAKGNVDKIIHVIPAGQVFFELKPGEKKNVVKGRLMEPLPDDAQLWSIFPHMHMLGKEMKVTAKLPDGSEKVLIWINDWDFNWQATYFYKEPIRLPKGTRIELIAVYDNSSSNPRQTSHPPVTVRFGEQTTDEMCFAFLGLTFDRERLNITASSKP